MQLEELLSENEKLNGEIVLMTERNVEMEDTWGHGEGEGEEKERLAVRVKELSEMNAALEERNLVL
jgi:hypothetical protein